MITPDEISKKARRKYRDVLRAYLQGENYFPILFLVGKPSKNLVQRRQQIQVLRESARSEGEVGYEIQWKTVNKRDLGEQTIPTHILIKSIDDYLRVVRKRTEFESFIADIAKIRSKFPQLEEWIQKYPHAVVENHGIWDDLLSVCHYFNQYPRPNIYIRELPIPIHTKFIEMHTTILQDLLDFLLPDTAINHATSDFVQRFGLKDKPTLVRTRLLEEQLDWLYTLRLDDLYLPVDQLSHLLHQHIKPSHIIVAENLINFLTIPSYPNTVAIFGGGFAVHVLKDVTWLDECNVVYWGDIDAHGFQILSDFRGLFPHIRSVMMDEETLNDNQEYVVRDNQLRADRFHNLTDRETQLLDYILVHEMRLEQEHIPHHYAVEKIKRTLLGNS